jgi:hypothetical protein
MSTSNIINSIGLVLDIIGVLLIWRYGLPEAISRTGTVHLIMENVDVSEIAEAKRYDCIARCGIVLLVGGFFLQLISNFL